MSKPTHQDALLKVTGALPNGAATINTPAIDLQNTSMGDLEGAELLIQLPALTVGELANAATMTYNIQDSVDAAFSSPRTLFSTVQTGAGGVGAAGVANFRRGLATDTRRYVRVQAINSGAGNASAKSVAMAVVFQAGG
jgi:hypothetical protein